jgi:hypothetical protein
MSGACAQKKPPERLRPRGAEDTTLFRERLDAPRSRGLSRRVGRTPVCPKRAAHVHVSGRSLRGPQENVVAAFPGADPSTWIVSSRPIHWSRRTLELALEAARIENFFPRVNGDFSKPRRIFPPGGPRAGQGTLAQRLLCRPPP